MFSWEHTVEVVISFSIIPSQRWLCRFLRVRLLLASSYVLTTLPYFILWTIKWYFYKYICVVIVSYWLFFLKHIVLFVASRIDRCKIQLILHIHRPPLWKIAAKFYQSSRNNTTFRLQLEPISLWNFSCSFFMNMLDSDSSYKYLLHTVFTPTDICICHLSQDFPGVRWCR